MRQSLWWNERFQTTLELPAREPTKTLGALYSEFLSEPEIRCRMRRKWNRQRHGYAERLCREELSDLEEEIFRAEWICWILDHWEGSSIVRPDPAAGYDETWWVGADPPRHLALAHEQACRDRETGHHRGVRPRSE